MKIELIHRDVNVNKDIEKEMNLMGMTMTMKLILQILAYKVNIEFKFCLIFFISLFNSNIYYFQYRNLLSLNVIINANHVMEKFIINV